MDDLLHLHHDPQVFMNKLKVVYRLNNGSLGPLTWFLGAKVEKLELGYGSVYWLETSREYCHAAIENVDNILELDGNWPLKVFGTKSGERPFLGPYRPGIDVMKVLGYDLHYWYLYIIGVIRWAIELGRIDIMKRVSVLPKHQCNQREGQMNSLYRIFWYLKCEISHGKNPNMGRWVYVARQT